MKLEYRSLDKKTPAILNLTGAYCDVSKRKIYATVTSLQR